MKKFKVERINGNPLKLTKKQEEVMDLIVYRDLDKIACFLEGLSFSNEERHHIFENYRYTITNVICWLKKIIDDDLE